MEGKGDIPERDEVEPPASLNSDEASAKVKALQALVESGGGHAYLESVPGDDEHFYEYNTHFFPEKGWVYFHGEDKDKWVPGTDIGMIERHYE